MKKLISFSVFLVVLLGFSRAAAQTRIHFNQQELFLNGANLEWINFARDIGPGITNFSRFEQIFRDVHANGGNAMRLWLHTTGAASPQFDANGMVIGAGQNTIESKGRTNDHEKRGHTHSLYFYGFDRLRFRARDRQIRA